MTHFEFRILTDDAGASEKEISMQGLAAIEAAIAMNVLYFQRHPEHVCALACGWVKYDSKNKNVLSLVADIKTAPILIEIGIGLCIDIVAFDVAVRRFEGKKAWPVILPRGGDIFHVVTETVDSTGNVVQLDPSLELERLGLAISLQPDQCTSCNI